MAGKVENWPELERMFVVDGKSHREIAVYAGTSNSTISQKAKRDDWTGRRIAYHQAIARRGYETEAAQSAVELDVIRKESTLLARAYLRTFANSIRDGSLKPNAKDALEFMKFLADQDPTGEAAKSGPTVISGTSVPVEGGDDFLRRIVEVARARVASPGGLGEDPLGDPPTTRTN
jgi:hypothetical protein